MNIDDLLYLIGKLTVEKEILRQTIADQEAQIKALLSKETQTPEAEGGK